MVISGDLFKNLFLSVIFFFSLFLSFWLCWVFTLAGFPSL